ncbi:MAG: pyridoxamine 5'-phosphate oxidase family protein [Mycobacterium sp.]
MRSDVVQIIREYRTCEFTTVSNGSPQTWPVSPLLLEDGRFLIATNIGLPQKILNIRRDPKVSLLFSDPTGSGIAQRGAVLIQGDATAGDRIVTDISSEPELAALAATVFARQPAGSFMFSPLGRRLFPYYFMRILIHVTPRRAYLWPTRDFATAPQQIDPKELQRVV